MENNINQSPDDYDEIDLKQLLKILLESKKLIISSVLVFTIASIIYSLSLKPLFISSAQIEISHFHTETENGDKKLIESTSDLISDLKILLLKNPVDKLIQNVSIKSFEERVILLEATSSSAEKNKNLLTEITNYIDERHSYLEKLFTNQRNDLLSFEIESTLAEITHFKSKLSDPSQSEYLNIISSLQEDDQKIELLKLLYNNSLNKDKIFDLNQKLSILNYELEKISSSVSSKSHIMHSLKTKTKKPKIALTILLGLSIGFINGIFLVLIRNFVKNLKES